MRVLTSLLGGVVIAVHPVWANDWPTDLPFEENNFQVAPYPVYKNTLLNDNAIIATMQRSEPARVHYPNQPVALAYQPSVVPVPNNSVRQAAVNPAVNPWSSNNSYANAWATNRYNGPINPWGMNQSWGVPNPWSGFGSWGNPWGYSFNPYGWMNPSGFNYPQWQTLNNANIAQGINTATANSYNPWINNLATPSVKQLNPLDLPHSSAYPVAAAIAANPLVPLYSGSVTNNPAAVANYPEPTALVPTPLQPLTYPPITSISASSIGYGSPANSPNPPVYNQTWTIPTPPPVPVAPTYQGFAAPNYANPNNLPPPPLVPLAPLPPTAPEAPSFEVTSPMPSEPIPPEPPVYSKEFAPILE